jgi:1-acyl-sn-glycerol-3-phosphate acyltransferase
MGMSGRNHNVPLRLIMRILRQIWAVFGIVLFLLMTACCIPYFLFHMAATPGKRALRRNIWFLHHPFANLFLLLTGVRRRVHGAHLLDRKQSYVIVANHASSIDFVVNAAAYPGIFRFLAKQELLKVPIFGWLVGKMCLIVDRKNAMSRARSVVALKKELEEGVSVLIYPEGSRNSGDTPLAPFYDGAFRLAIQMGAPILPMTITNIKAVSHAAKGLDLWPGMLDIYFDAPIETNGLKGEDATNLMERVRLMMEAHITQKSEATTQYRAVE